MRVEVEYIRFDEINGQLVRQDGSSYEIVEIDETQGSDLDKLVDDVLSTKTGLHKNRYKIMSLKQV